MCLSVRVSRVVRSATLVCVRKAAVLHPLIRRTVDRRFRDYVASLPARSFSARVTVEAGRLCVFVVETTRARSERIAKMAFGRDQKWDFFLKSFISGGNQTVFSSINPLRVLWVLEKRAQTKAINQLLNATKMNLMCFEFCYLQRNRWYGVENSGRSSRSNQNTPSGSPQHLQTLWYVSSLSSKGPLNLYHHLRPPSTFPLAKKGVFSGLKQIVKNESFFALYRGNGAQMVNILSFLSLDAIRKHASITRSFSPE